MTQRPTDPQEYGHSDRPSEETVDAWVECYRNGALDEAQKRVLLNFFLQSAHAQTFDRYYDFVEELQGGWLA